MVRRKDGDGPADVAAAAAWEPLVSLVPHPRNPRRNEATIPVVAESMRRFGFGAPMVARRANRMILAGHARHGAALLLIEQWPKATSRERATWHPDAVRIAEKGEVIVRFVDLDEHDADLYLVADNRIGEELSETDDEQLAALLNDKRAAGLDLTSGTGFREEDLAALLGGATPGGGAGDITGGDPGDGRYKEQFGVIVLCTGEAEQAKIYEQLKGEGFTCRVVVT